MSQNGDPFDYIVIGAGSAGCVLAARLSEDPSTRVLLLEAGPPDTSPWIHMPAGIAKVFFNPKVNWGYWTEPERHMDGRKIYWAKGKTLGGSSSINGMSYVRGHARDFDLWRQHGNPGWDWDSVLPYFRRSERNSRGTDAYHAADGPLAVSDPAEIHPTARAFVEAGVAAGLERNPDFNGVRQEGVGFLQSNLSDGRRMSSAKAFLDPAKRRPNLRIETNSLTHRIMFDGNRATGVVYETDGETFTAHASGEVLLSAGSVASPQILQLSGIGPAVLLREHGIDVVCDCPGVGENLQDHFYAHYLARVSPGASANSRVKGLPLLAALLNYALRSRGPLSYAFSQAAAFVRSDPALERPDLQINFRATSVEFTADGKIVPTDYPGVSASVCHLQPESRGTVRIQSSDPRAHPRIHANYMDASADQRAISEGLRIIRRIFAHSPLKDLVEEELAPGPGIESDEAIGAFIRTAGQSMYHPVGTCKMGTDNQAVVDADLRVRGTRGLRVVDASIMPLITSGNTHAPTVMIAEKASDLIRAQKFQISAA